jgi:hypothetical protein
MDVEGFPGRCSLIKKADHMVGGVVHHRKNLAKEEIGFL